MDVRRIPDVMERPCPFVHRGDPRCAGRFGLPRVAAMFGHCFGQPSACPVYHRLQRERRLRGHTVHSPIPSYPDAEPVGVGLTLFGERLDPADTPRDVFCGAA